MKSWPCTRTYTSNRLQLLSTCTLIIIVNTPQRIPHNRLFRRTFSRILPLHSVPRLLTGRQQPIIMVQEGCRRFVPRPLWRCRLGLMTRPKETCSDSLFARSFALLPEPSVLGSHWLP